MKVKKPRKWLWVIILAVALLVAGAFAALYKGSLYPSAATLFPTSSPAKYFYPSAQVDRANLVAAFVRAKGLVTIQTTSSPSLTSPVPTSPKLPTFKDVPTTFWAYKEIEAAYKAGLVKGCRSDSTGLYFCPNDLATRATLAVLAVRSFPKAADIATSPFFTDVPPTYWAYREIETAKVLHYMGGYGDGTFRPEVIVTRDMLAVVVSRATGKIYKPITPTFVDVPATNWAFTEIEGVYRAGYMSGFNAPTSPSPIVSKSPSPRVTGTGTKL